MTTKDRNALTLPHSYDRAALARFELFLFAGIATVLITTALIAASTYVWLQTLPKLYTCQKI